MMRRQRKIPLSETLADAVTQAMAELDGPGGRELRQADLSRETGVSEENIRRMRRAAGGTIGYELAEPVLRYLALDPDDFTEPDRTWQLPKEFDDVPHEDRPEAERALRWMMRVRARSGHR